MGAIITVKDYLSALKANRLLGFKCLDCGFITAPPRQSCRKCGSQHGESVELSGRGKVVSFTAVHLPPASHAGKAPYLVALIELAEGAWLMGNLLGTDPANTTVDIIGRAVVMDNSALAIENDRPAAPCFNLI